MRFLKPLLLAATLALSGQANAVSVSSGQTSVLLDTPLLATVGLSLSGVGGPVIVPGNLGPDSVAFSINGRDAAAPALPTTFSYTAGTLAPFSGTIEHTGTVLFNDGALEVGNFTIGFDAGRAGAATSGFFVADNVTSHAEDLAAYSEARQSDPTLVSVTVPPDRGLELTTVIGEAAVI